MPDSLAPGAYHTVIDGSSYRRAAGSVRVGIEGIADWGPMNTPTHCPVTGELNAKFGGINYAGLYAAEEILQRTIYVYFSRIGLAVDLAKASIALVDGSTDIIDVTALYNGVFGNTVSIEILDSSSGTITEFNMQVLVGGVVKETYVNLTETSYLNVSSDYVVLTESAGAPVWPANWTTISGTFTLIGGNSGTAVTDTEWVGARGNPPTSAHTGLYVYSTDEFRSLDFVTLPEVTSDTALTALFTMLNTYHNKQVMGVVDGPNNMTRDESMDFINGDQPDGVGPASIVDRYNIVFSYPWHTRKTTAGVEFDVGASGPYIGTVAQSVKIDPFKAPAGYKRGIWEFSTALVTEFSKTDIAIVYSQDGQCVNMWYKDENKGIVLLGQKTTYRTNSDLNRVKTVFNLNRMIKELDAKLEGETFEDSNQVTWDIVTNFAVQVLKPRLKAGLLWAYEFNCNLDTNTNSSGVLYPNEIHSQAKVQFTPTAEWIMVDWILSPAGSSFEIT